MLEALLFAMKAGLLAFVGALVFALLAWGLFMVLAWLINKVEGY